MNLRYVGLGMVVFLLVASLLRGEFVVRDMARSVRAAELGDRAWARMSEEKYREAIGDFERALAYRPEAKEFRLRVLMPLGDCYYRIGDFRRMEQLYLEYLQNRPWDPYACNNLAYYYAEKGIHLDRALELIVRAFRSRPGDPVLIDTLGWIYYRKGWWLPAEMELQRAADIMRLLKRPDPEILYHLAAVYAQQERYGEARRVLQDVLTLKPDYPEARKLLEQVQTFSRPAAGAKTGTRSP